VHAVCNTPKTFAHFSLALRNSIGDNPARSETAVRGPAILTGRARVDRGMNGPGAVRNPEA